MRSTEAPGILFKLIKALGRYLKDHDFKMPGTVAAASKEYLFSQDIVGQWLIECCDTTDPNARCTLKEMWASWQPWAEKHNEWVGKFDGKDYPVTGDPSSDTRSLKQIDAHTLALTVKKGGKVTMSGPVVLSADGKSRTLTLKGTDAAGKKVTSVSVYDKE